MSRDSAKTPGADAPRWLQIILPVIFLAVIYWFTHNMAIGVTNPILIFAALAGAYMAMNIGANDVANNVGPAVGSNAITLGGAIILAAICESAGALIAGGHVVTTIKSGIINPDLVGDTTTFIWLMTAALLAGALWLNFATWMGAPVSTTHSIVGGVLGAGLAAGGMGIANWSSMGAIAASWVISPLMGGFIAAVLLMFIKKAILYRDDVDAAARVYVPWLVAFMAWAFISYLLLKGMTQIWKPSLLVAQVVALGVSVGVYLFSRARTSNYSSDSNSPDGVNRLFTIPLVFAAGLLSFAHGANDVANAIGPLAAINEALSQGVVASKAAIPLWIMLIGALGLVIGLALFGPKLIKTVGGEITELDKTRAYCIAMSAAITVIIASQLGLPVSSTHIALGGVFGVGFLREYLKTRYASQLHGLLDRHQGEQRAALERFLARFSKSSVEEMRRMLKKWGTNPVAAGVPKSEKKRIKKIYKQELVKRKHLYRIAAAWIITVPASALLAAIAFFTLKGMFCGC